MSGRSKRNKNNTNNDSNDSNDDVQPPSPGPQFITINQLEKAMADNREELTKIIKEAIHHELSSMKQEISRLDSALETATGIANNAMKLTEQLKKDVTLLKEENAYLKTQLRANKIEQTKNLESIEDNKNRQLRKTIIFKGIEEKKSGGENWEDTTAVLAESMSESLGTTVDAAKKMVERCHRARPNPNYKGTMPRPIFASFLDWRDSEATKEAFRRSRNGVIAEQKVGPLTTIRRNMALKERKRLLDDGTILHGYVAHPAVLMVKDSTAPTAKYRKYKDFSNEAVKLRDK